MTYLVFVFKRLFLLDHMCLVAFRNVHLIVMAFACGNADYIRMKFRMDISLHYCVTKNK